MTKVWQGLAGEILGVRRRLVWKADVRGGRGKNLGKCQVGLAASPPRGESSRKAWAQNAHESLPAGVVFRLSQEFCSEFQHLCPN